MINEYLHLNEFDDSYVVLLKVQDFRTFEIQKKRSNNFLNSLSPKSWTFNKTILIMRN